MYARQEWRREALKIMKACPHHIFVTLTKQYDKLWMIAADSPELSRMGWTPHAIESVRAELSRVGSFTHIPSREIPRNVIVGISVTKRDQVRGIDELREVPAFRLVCFEPLLEDVSDLVDLTGIGWIIIGKRTKQRKIPEFTPEWEWVDRLITKARELDIPVFLKPSMTFPAGWVPIQETPYDYIRTTMLAEVIKYETYLEHQNKAIKKVLMEDE
jgi:protein gp37